MADGCLHSAEAHTISTGLAKPTRLHMGFSASVYKPAQDARQ